MQKEFDFDCEMRSKYLERFNVEYPQYDTGIIGRSILGRDIDYYKIGKGKKNILAVGAHHGMEYITEAALYDFIGFICEKAARGQTFCNVNICFLLQKFTFWIVPCVNPDGVEMSLSGISKTPLYDRQIRMNGGRLDFKDWQANARGVDLNHNYAFGFAEYKQIEKENKICAGKTRFSGEYPESEPETKSLANLIRTLMPNAVVSLHSQGEEIFSKPDTSSVLRIAEKLARTVGYNLSTANGYAAYGGLSDYAGGVLGIPSFTVEVGRGTNPLPSSSYKAAFDAVRKLLVTLPTLL